jgi:hypothetical protein
LSAGRPAEAILWYAKGVTKAERALELNPNLADAKRWRLFCFGAGAQAYEAQQDYVGATRNWDRAVDATGTPSEKRTFRFYRLVALVRAGEDQRALEEIDDLSDTGKLSADDHYTVARSLAILAGRSLDSSLAARSVAALRSARDAHPTGLPRLTFMFDAWNNRDLKPLRDREDYRAVLAGTDRPVVGK